MQATGDKDGTGSWQTEGEGKGDRERIRTNSNDKQIKSMKRGGYIIWNWGYGV
jgi:hypothetical protein